MATFTERIRAIITAEDRGASRTFKKVGTSAKVMGGVIAAVATGVLARQMVRALGAVAEAAGRQEKSLVSLGQAIKNQGGDVAALLPKYAEFAGEMQTVTGVSDDVILKNQELLVSLGKLSGEGLTRTTKAAIELSTITGDTRGAFLLLARAAAGSTETLTRYGITIDKSIPKAQQFEAALKFIEDRLGGAAARKMMTYEGSVLGVANAWDDLKKAIGGPISRVFAVFNREILTPMIVSLTRGVNNSNAFRDAVYGAADGTLAFAEAAVIAVSPVADLLAEIKALADKTPEFLANIPDEVNKTGNDIREKLKLWFSDPLLDQQFSFEKLLGLGQYAQGPGVKKTGLLELVGIDTDPARAEEEVNPYLARVLELIGNARAALSRDAASPSPLLLGAGDAVTVVADKLDEIEEKIITIEAAAAGLAIKGFGAWNAELIKSRTRIEQIGTAINRSFRANLIGGVDGFTDALVDSAKTGKQAFQNFFKQLLIDIAKAIVKMTILDQITKSLGSRKKSGSPLGALAGLAGLAFGPVGAFASLIGPSVGLSLPFRSGGEVPKYSAGGMAGMGTLPNSAMSPLFGGGMLSVLHPGERVLTSEQNDALIRSMSSGGGLNGPITIELRSDIPMVADMINRGVNEGHVKLTATDFVAPRTRR